MFFLSQNIGTWLNVRTVFHSHLPRPTHFFFFKYLKINLCRPNHVNGTLRGYTYSRICLYAFPLMSGAYSGQPTGSSTYTLKNVLS
jgi:hypothetical protein